MSKYREINQNDRTPVIPDGITLRYINDQLHNEYTLLFGESETHRYTFVWDGFSPYPNSITVDEKDK